jgi:hypothetical protein
VLTERASLLGYPPLHRFTVPANDLAV